MRKDVRISGSGAVRLRDLLDDPAVGRDAPQPGIEAESIDDAAVRVPCASPRHRRRCKIDRCAPGDGRPSQLSSGKKSKRPAVGREEGIERAGAALYGTRGEVVDGTKIQLRGCTGSTGRIRNQLAVRRYRR